MVDRVAGKWREGRSEEVEGERERREGEKRWTNFIEIRWMTIIRREDNC